MIEPDFDKSVAVRSSGICLDQIGQRACLDGREQAVDNAARSAEVQDKHVPEIAELPLVDQVDSNRYPLGTTHRLRCRAGTLPDGSPVAIPAILFVGRRRRPKLVAVGGVHGDELVGPRALMDLAQELRPAGLHGTVILVPVANPLAYNAGMRETPVDGLNLNRVFPGQATGTLTQQLAATLIQRIIGEADLVIDLHSAERTAVMMPMSGFRAGRGETARQSAAAATAFGLELIWLMRWAPGTLSTAVNERGIPAVGCEIGGLGDADPTNGALYRQGVVRCLRHLGILDPPLDVDVPRRVWTHTEVVAPCSGLLEIAVDLRQQVQAGERLACVRDPWGDVVAEVVAPDRGLVVYKRVFGTVRAGEVIVMLGHEIDNPVLDLAI